MAGPVVRGANLLSVDVEDYFQVQAFADVVARESWDQWPSRVVANTERALDLFARHRVCGTFFFLGWVAERFPALVRRVQESGHELACHGYWHRTIYSLTPEQFREDTRNAKHRIEQAAGVRVYGYRAPSWSVTRQSLWALDILAEEGFTYDSSIFPIRHDLYGIPGAQRFRYTHQCGNGLTLEEFPPATVSLLGCTAPAAGGGYLRLFPLWYNTWAFRQIGARQQPVVVYFHPWELDPGQPRIAAKLRSRFRHYHHLDKMESRLERLLGAYPFQRFCDALSDRPETASATGAAG